MDTGDPYASILSICSISSFQLPPGNPPPLLPPAPPPFTDIDLPLFGPIPDHLLPDYLCLNPVASTPPIATAATNNSLDSFDDSHPNNPNPAVVVVDDVDPRNNSNIINHDDSESPLPASQVPPIFICCHDDHPSHDTIPVDAAPKQHQNPTPPVCTLLLSLLKSIAVSSQHIMDSHVVIPFLLKFRNSAFVLGSESPSRALGLLRSDGDWVSHRPKDDSSSSSFLSPLTRSKAKSLDGNSDNFVSLSYHPSSSKIAETSKGSNLPTESQSSPKAHRPIINAETRDCFSCAPKRGLNLDSSSQDSSVKKSKFSSSSRNGQGCLTSGVCKNNSATPPAEVGSRKFSPDTSFSAVVLRALQMIKSMNFELNDDNEEELRLWPLEKAMGS
ncbi:hypothetical protein ACH5RR_000027 [Cinchona calisaya]|uniref:Uncharacterized protein n=1 Tax=Cinchona calisaya TaxID=153742 RepID=A0ABD3AZY9_9GENT